MFALNENVSVKIKDVAGIGWNKSLVSVAPRNVHALVYRQKGSAHFECMGKRTHSGEGDVFYMPANMGYRANYTEDNEVYVFHFETDFKGTMDNQADINSEFAASLFKKALDIWQKRAPGYYCEVMGLFCEILNHLSEREQLSTRNYPPSFPEALEYLRHNFTSPELTVESLAEMSHISTTYFRKLFKTRYLISPLEYISNLRFGYAERLLSTGKYTIEEVAYMSGFNDAKYFSRRIKNKYGVPPSALYKFN